MKNNYHVSIDEAIQLLSHEKSRFVEVMKDGDMTIEYYAPVIIDEQQPHKKMSFILLLPAPLNF